MSEDQVWNRSPTQKRLVGLLRFYHRVFRHDPVCIAQAGDEVPRYWFEMLPDDRVSVSFAMPMVHIGRSQSGLGIIQSDFPRSLWPLQLSIAVALRYAALGIKPGLGWPDHVLVEGSVVANAATEIRDNAVVGKLRASLAPLRSLYPSAEVAIVQSVLSVLESPWPPALMLRHYRGWCRDLGMPCAPVVESGMLPPVARDVGERGQLILEEADGSRREFEVFT